MRELEAIKLDDVRSYIKTIPIGDEWVIKQAGDSKNNIESTAFIAKVKEKYTHHVVLEEKKRKGFKRKVDVLIIDLFLNRNGKKVIV